MKIYKRIFKEKKYNLQLKFNEFNKKLFDGKISNDYKIIFGDTGNDFLVGVAHVNAIPPFIVLSKALSKSIFPHEIIDIVLIHEMIHAFLYQKEGVSYLHDPHGDSFKKEIRRIETKFPEYEIPYKENWSAVEKILDRLGIE